MEYVIEMRRDLDEGRRQLRASARNWHAFDLKAFEKELRDIRAIAHKARTDALAQIAVKRQ